MFKNASEHLQGRKLATGWEVIEKCSRDANATGGTFSSCYKVKKIDEPKSNDFFLKAFDFESFFHHSTPGISVIDMINEMTNAYLYERDISEYCKNKHITKVVLVRDYGEERIDGFPIPIVPYLIFELADCDVRHMLNTYDSSDLAWKFSSLHSVAVGLKQLHQHRISHQDIKPSNILVYQTDCKIGDLGRSQTSSTMSPFKDMKYAGDLNYAPPEILYRYYIEDWHSRAYAIDLYLLGNLFVFYLTGVTMNSLLKDALPENISWEHWKGSYEEVSDFVVNSFNTVLTNLRIEIQGCIEDKNTLDNIILFIKHACHPVPESRGHPKNSPYDQYGLERFISMLNHLRFNAMIRM